jgi:sec-independent protein translocase protein TatA
MNPPAYPILLLFEVGSGELMLIVFVALLLYGGDLPKIARSVGRVVSDLRRSADTLTREFREDEVRRPAPPRRPLPDPRSQPQPPVIEDRREPPTGAETAEAASPPPASESPAAPRQDSSTTGSVSE